jgi:tetratricopeptide (TPR) repeat protein
MRNFLFLLIMAPFLNSGIAGAQIYPDASSITKTEEVKNLPVNTEGDSAFEKARTAIAEELKTVTIRDNANGIILMPGKREVKVLDDHLEVTDLKKHNTVVLDYSVMAKNYRTEYNGPLPGGKDQRNYYYKIIGIIEFINCSATFHSNLEYLCRYSDAIKKHKENELLQIKHKDELLQFEAVAAQYRTLKTKPSVSEEQRKFIVQANMFGERKDYGRAIELYDKVIEINPTSYPEAYYNMALLKAQINRFIDAIYYMNKYLLLVPDSKEARSAQDKIYEWEAFL